MIRKIEIKLNEQQLEFIERTLRKQAFSDLSELMRLAIQEQTARKAKQLPQGDEVV